MWWYVLVAPAGAMTSREAVDAAVGRSPTMQVAAARVAEADARVKEVRSKLMPSASLSGFGLFGPPVETQIKKPDTTNMPKDIGNDIDLIFDQLAANPTVLLDTAQFVGVGNLTMPLVSFQGWSGVALSKDAADLARTEAEGQKTQIAKAALEAWHTTYAAQSLLTESQRAKDLATRLLEKGQKLSELGAIASQDLIPFKRAIATADAQVAGATAALEAATGVLHLLTGLDGAPTEPTLPTAPPPLDQLLAQMDRPDVRAADERAGVADSRVSVEKKARLPTLGLVAGGVYLAPSADILNNNLIWRVGAGLNVPLTQGGLVTAKANEAQAQAAQAEAGARAIHELAEIEVRTAHGTLARALTVLQAQETAVNLAQEAVDASEKRMGEGGGTLVQLQQLQLELIIAEAQRLTARSDAAKAADMLELAVHGTSG
jgi:multidrug efflux system outer membrane protein